MLWKVKAKIELQALSSGVVSTCRVMGRELDSRQLFKLKIQDVFLQQRVGF
jgi:hypothetical protein